MVKVPVKQPRMVNVDYAHKVLSADELRAVVDEVNQRAGKDFYGANVLDSPMIIQDGVLRITPINGTILFGQVVSKNFPGVYVSTRAEVERALQEGLDHQGVYSYDSLCLGGVDYSGKRLNGRDLDFACRLMGVDKKLKDLSCLDSVVSKEPALVPISKVSLEADRNLGFHYAISPDLEGSLIYDKRLKQKGNFNETDFERGLPIFDGNCKRIIFPNDGVLRGVYLDDGLGLGAVGGSWAIADCNSRVVLTDTREASRD